MLKSGHRKITLFLTFLTGACAIAIILIIRARSVVPPPNEDLATRYTDGSETEAVPTASDSTYLDIRDDDIQLDLKQEYFDDLNAIWGTGSESGEFIGEAFDSEYAPRSAPRPINHPIEIKQENITLKQVKRREIKLDPFSENDPLSTANRVVNENYKEYGELIGGSFSSWNQAISNIEEADVDMDGAPEKLITTSDIGANHPPHHAYVVKDNVIIVSVELISGYIKPAKDGNGFYIKDPDPAGDWGEGMSYLSPLCCPMGYRIYRVVYEDSRFVPVWEQDVIYLQFKEPK